MHTRTLPAREVGKGDDSELQERVAKASTKAKAKETKAKAKAKAMQKRAGRAEWANPQLRHPMQERVARLLVTRSGLGINWNFYDFQLPEDGTTMVGQQLVDPDGSELES